jgi:selenocysteine lyase/cysteine desulfurase
MTSTNRRQFLAVGGACAALAPLIGLEAAPQPSWSKLAPEAPGVWSRVRDQYFIEAGLVYLNTGTYGPTLRAAYEAASANLRAMGANYNRAFRETMMGEAVPRFIARVAAFVGAKPDEVAFTSGTTEAMNTIANGLDLLPGDEILTTRHEHQGGIYPWLLQAKRRGVVVRQIDLRTPPGSSSDIVEQFARELTPRTRVLSFSHIQYTDGAVMPARELCALARQHGALSVVDGAQAIGQLDFRIADLECDFYAGSFHKWLTSPYGCGLLYVREEHLDRLWPSVVLSYSGWSPVDRDGRLGITDITYAPNYPRALLKFSSNVEYYGPLYWTVALAMDFQQLLGRARIETRVRELATRLQRGLNDVRGVRLHTADASGLRAGLVSFRIEGFGTEEAFLRMRSDWNLVGRYVRHAGIGFDVNRFSTHIYNDEAQVDLALEAVEALAGSGGRPGLTSRRPVPPARASAR